MTRVAIDNVMHLPEVMGIHDAKKSSCIIQFYSILAKKRNVVMCPKVQ